MHSEYLKHLIASRAGSYRVLSCRPVELSCQTEEIKQRGICRPSVDGISQNIKRSGSQSSQTLNIYREVKSLSFRYLTHCCKKSPDTATCFRVGCLKFEKKNEFIYCQENEKTNSDLIICFLLKSPLVNIFHSLHAWTKHYAVPKTSTYLTHCCQKMGRASVGADWVQIFANWRHYDANRPLWS